MSFHDILFFPQDALLLLVNFLCMQQHFIAIQYIVQFLDLTANSGLIKYLSILSNLRNLSNLNIYLGCGKPESEAV